MPANGRRDLIRRLKVNLFSILANCFARMKEYFFCVICIGCNNYPVLLLKFCLSSTILMDMGFFKIYFNLQISFSQLSLICICFSVSDYQKSLTNIFSCMPALVKIIDSHLSPWVFVVGN